ncbi:MAG: hypothetical protein SVW57_14110, partial [Thermodesulfobacteriota bacterium]|nr:hypothetical protein [Thermodesulfobacteriota bacterium]
MENKVIQGILHLCTPTFRQLLRPIKAGDNCTINGVHGSAQSLLTSFIYRELATPLIFISPSDEEAEDFFNDITFFIQDTSYVDLYLYKSTPYIDIINLGLGSVEATLNILYKLSKGNGKNLIVTTLKTLSKRLVPFNVVKQNVQKIELGDQIERDFLIEMLNDWGFRREYTVGNRGEMSIRGDIVDIFPPYRKSPVRLEVPFDVIESIREFDPLTQRSSTYMNELLLLPAQEIVIREQELEIAFSRIKERADALNIPRSKRDNIIDRIKNQADCLKDSLLPFFYDETSTIFDYVPDRTIFMYERPYELEDEFHRFWRKVETDYERVLHHKNIVARPEELFMSLPSLKEKLDSFSCVTFNDIESKGPSWNVVNLDITENSEFQKKEHQPFQNIIETIKDLQSSNFVILMSATSKEQSERIDFLLGSNEISTSLNQETLNRDKVNIII